MTTDDCVTMNHDHDPRVDSVISALSRREIVGSGLLLGALLLTGCGTRKSTSALKSPKLSGPSAVIGEPPTKVSATMPPLGSSPQILPRSAWTRIGPVMSNINPMRGVSRITVHHDGMNAFTSASESDAKNRLSSILNSHRNRKDRGGKNWADIGYHYVIDPAGRVWEARNIMYQGAHVQDQNEHNLGIMMMGNYEIQSPSPAAQASLDRLVASMMRSYNVPLSRVKTHKELAATACPGRSLQSYMLRTRSRGGALALACDRGLMLG